MSNIKHVPTINFYNNYVVEVQTIEEALETLIPKIRQKSQQFYSEHIKNQLQEKGSTLIDRHAGNGCFYQVFLKS